MPVDEQDNRWNILIVDEQEVYRYFGQPVSRERIEAVMYVYGANEPKLMESKQSPRVYEFESNRRKSKDLWGV